MIDTSVESLFSEITAGEQLRDKRFCEAAKIVKQYHTLTYDGSAALDVPENHAFEYISLIVPQMIFENPVMFICNEDYDEFSDNGESRQLEKATNRVLYLRRMREKGIQAAIDQCFCWSVGRVDQQPVPGATPGEVNKDGSFDLPMMPDYQRISQNHFCMDPLAITKAQARWTSFDVVRDKKDLLDEATRFPNRGWDAAAIEKITPSVDTKLRPMQKDLRGIDRKELWFKEIWIPEEELDDSLGPQDGFHGTIRTICLTGQGGMVEIRKARPYYGPPSGPAVIFGTHLVPDELWPLSALYPVQTQVKDLNAHGLHVRDAAARHKRVGLGDALSAKDSQAIKDAKNGEFLLVAGLDKQKVLEIELGGITEAMMVYRNFARDLLDRTSGMTDAMRGNVTGDATASENIIADNAGNVRTSFVKRQFQSAMREVGEKFAWFCDHDERTEVPHANGDTYHGGHGEALANRLRKKYPGIQIPDDWGQQQRIPFESRDIRIEPGSMERVDQGQQQRNAMQAYTLALQAVPVMAQFPDALDYRGLFEDIGRAFNSPHLAKRVRPQAANENAIAMAQLEAGDGAAQPGAAPKTAPGEGGRGIGAASPERKGDLLKMQRRIGKSQSAPQVRPKVGQARMVK